MKRSRTLGAFVIWLLMVACIAPSSEAQTVYVTKTGSKYHRASCQYLRKSQYAIAMKEAVERGYEPCSVCEPGSPAKEKKKTPDPLTEKSKDPDTTATESTQTPIPQSPKPKEARSSQCTATTKAGTRCKRITTNASGRCYQHE